MTAKKLNCRQAHWSLHLARFDFLLYHCPGRIIGIPDALLRRADHGNSASDNENITNGHLLFVMGALILYRVQKCEVRQVTKDVVKSEV